MRVGCGVYEHTVRRRRYLYFWHYETQGGRRRQISEYVGPAGSLHAREEAARRCEAYYARAREAIDRIRAATLARLPSSR
jgi:hypothetical protein